ncbi:MAG: hypothetical protein LBE38_03990 [Deltaproteobacteria bacterium]|jgi:hypothetical protein|nr:hypothetical protein [Deltaproteobacteria bacterium]
MPKFILAFLVVFFWCLPAQAQDNPYLGVWDVSTDNAQGQGPGQNYSARSVEFTDSEILYKINGETINSLPVLYKKDTRGNWLICQEDNTNCAILPVKDGKMEFPPESAGDITVIYTKRTSPPKDENAPGASAPEASGDEGNTNK